MEKTYINLVPVMSGGGLQNAINLIIGIHEIESDKNKYVFLIRNKLLEEILKEKQMQYVKINDSIFARLFYELFYFLGKKDNIILTLFGGKPLLTYKNFTISGCAYSNLFYPDINFWGYLSFFNKTIKKLKDIYRYNLIKLSDVVVFETEILKERAINLKKFSPNRTYVIKMAVNKIVSESNNKTFNGNFTKNIKDKFKILYLGSSHPNKRQHLLINIAKEVKKKNNNFCFITTMENNNYTKEFISKIEKEDLTDVIFNIGPVESIKVGELIKECDSMINIAELESFSNNFVEAWTFKKTLILTDADWSRGSCKESAYYISPENPCESASKIISLIENKQLQENIIDSYDDILSEYLDYKQKTKKYIELINNFREGADH